MFRINKSLLEPEIQRSQQQETGFIKHILTNDVSFVNQEIIAILILIYKGKCVPSHVEGISHLSRAI